MAGKPLYVEITSDERLTVVGKPAPQTAFQRKQACRVVCRADYFVAGSVFFTCVAVPPPPIHEPYLQ